VPTEGYLAAREARLAQLKSDAAQRTFEERELAVVYAVLPDVEPAAALKQLRSVCATMSEAHSSDAGVAGERVLLQLLDLPGGYPKKAAEVRAPEPESDDEDSADEQAASGKKRRSGNGKARQGETPAFASLLRRAHATPSVGRRSRRKVSSAAGIECPVCCDDSFPLDALAQCPDGHVFCKACCRRMAEEQIGMRKHELRCMDEDGCELEFATR
jgi:hypothetical protein